MPNPANKEIRLYFIVSSNFGELGYVMSFLFRQKIAKYSILLLPKHLYEFNRDHISIKTKLYRSYQDISNILDESHSDVVFLFSGYLFTSDKIFTVSQVRQLVAALKKKRARVMTSDPMLGLQSRVNAKTIDASIFKKPYKSLIKRIYQDIILFYSKWVLTWNLTKLFNILKDIEHLYLAPLNGISLAEDIKHIEFFNRNLVQPNKVYNAASNNHSIEKWVFVLAAIDLQYQEQIFGPEEFVLIVINKLNQSIAFGVYPVLIAPAAFINKVSDKISDISQLSLISNSSYEEFMDILLGARFAFYWNIFSNSIYIRFVNRLSMFFFDEGHLVRLVKPMHKLGIECYYKNEHPIILDINCPLDREELISLEDEWAVAAKRIYTNICDLPSPDNIIRSKFD